MNAVSVVQLMRLCPYASTITTTVD